MDRLQILILETIIFGIVINFLLNLWLKPLIDKMFKNE